MFSKLQTLSWYLKQPKGIALVWLLIKRKTIYASREKTRMEAEQWCRQYASDTQSALKKLFPDLTDPVMNLETKFPEEFSFAYEKVKSTPYKMGGQGNIVLLYNICERIGARYVLETGVAYGWSSLSILLSLKNRDESLLISTDMPYAKMGNDNYVGIAVAPGLRNCWKLIREPDISSLPKALREVPYLDVVHYDSDKSYLGRMMSYPKLYNKLRPAVFLSQTISMTTLRIGISVRS